MTDLTTREGTVFLPDQAAGPGARRLACAIIVASTVAFLGVAPFAKVSLGPALPFIPIYQSALLINDFITAAFLLGQSRISCSGDLRLLAGGYLFCSLMASMHMLSFPGLFTPSGLLGAGPQTAAWLWMMWHGGFPIFVIAYASYGRERDTVHGTASVLVTAASVFAVVGGLTLLATVGQRLLPPILQDNRNTSALFIVVSVVWLLNLSALSLLSRRKPYSVLDLWLIVAMCAWLFDVALSSMLNGGRYDLGFYAGRIYGLLAASFVLVVLLHESGKLYLQLHTLRESDRAKAVELHRLSTIDQLTGIANRRAFDDALNQEWRRLMRHGTMLSLLMIDVDFFKRFNDAYGHVAGDQCLRAVGQVIGGKARRAGELAARYGGEEFAVLLPHLNLADARKLGEVICAAVREQNIPHEKSEAASCLTVSIGAATISDLPKLAATLSRKGTLPSASMPGATVLIEMADHALYQAKVAGRNRVVIASAIDETAVEYTRSSREIPSAA
jgi:diguanylate cyclase (GGDEF)-like protein